MPNSFYLWIKILLPFVITKVPTISPLFGIKADVNTKTAPKRLLSKPLLPKAWAPPHARLGRWCGGTHTRRRYLRALTSSVVLLDYSRTTQLQQAQERLGEIRPATCTSRRMRTACPIERWSLRRRDHDPRPASHGMAGIELTAKIRSVLSMSKMDEEEWCCE